MKKNDPPPNPPDTPPGGNNNNNGGAANADSVSNHLQFLSVNKIHGQIPQGPTGGSMKISFKDTLYLVDQVKIPIKFLHLDTTQNVTGVFIHVEGLLGGSFGATDY